MPRNTSISLGDHEAALIEGEASGPPTAFDFDAFKARKRSTRTQAERHLA